MSSKSFEWSIPVYAEMWLTFWAGPCHLRVLLEVQPVTPFFHQGNTDRCPVAL